MNDIQQEQECLKSVLRAVQAYRGAPSAEALMKTLQARVIEQRQRYDKLVHSRTSKERELEAALNALKAFKQESAGRLPDKASQRRLRIANSSLAKSQMKLQEAQSIEQMYRALILQLRNDRDVARKDLADMEVACDKADREMMQLQQQLKQRRVEHAAALDQHNTLRTSLERAKHEAHLSVAHMQHDILGYHGQNQADVQQTCTLEGARADAKAGESQLQALLLRVSTTPAAALRQENVNSAAALSVPGAGQTSCPNAAAAGLVPPENNELSCASLAMVSCEEVYSRTVLEAAESTPKESEMQSVSPEPGQITHICTQVSCLTLDGAMAGLCVNADMEMTSLPVNLGAACGVAEADAPELSLLQADYTSTRAVSCSGTEDSRGESLQHSEQGKRYGGADSDVAACALEASRTSVDKRETRGSDTARAEPPQEDQENGELSEAELLEAWGVVEKCIPSVRCFGGSYGGLRVDEVMQTAEVIAEAQNEMVAVLQQWVDSGQAELARRHEGAMVIPAD